MPRCVPLNTTANNCITQHKKLFNPLYKYSQRQVSILYYNVILYENRSCLEHR